MSFHENATADDDAGLYDIPADIKVTRPRDFVKPPHGHSRRSRRPVAVHQVLKAPD